MAINFKMYIKTLKNNLIILKKYWKVLIMHVSEYFIIYNTNIKYKFGQMLKKA